MDEDKEKPEPAPVPVPPPKHLLRARGAERRYPIRQLMLLIENIAARQRSLHRADWTAWGTLLGQTVRQAKGRSELKAFTNLDLNPLSALWHAPFRPDFSESADTPEGALYESVLRDIEAEWKVAGHRAMGEAT